MGLFNVIDRRYMFCICYDIVDYQVCFKLLLHSHLINNCTSGRFNVLNRRNDSVTIFLVFFQIYFLRGTK